MNSQLAQAKEELSELSSDFQVQEEKCQVIEQEHQLELSESNQ